jgi:hypothetical protein
MIECCSELAKMNSGYQPKNWSMHPSTINQWGGPPPPRFLLTGFPMPNSGRPPQLGDASRPRHHHNPHNSERLPLV